MSEHNGIQVPVAAAISVLLMPDGNVTVEAKGQINAMTVEGMLGNAKRLLHKQIEEAHKGPQVVQAPPGVRF